MSLDRPDLRSCRDPQPIRSYPAFSSARVQYYVSLFLKFAVVSWPSPYSN